MGWETSNIVDCWYVLNQKSLVVATKLLKVTTKPLVVIAKQFGCHSQTIWLLQPNNLVVTAKKNGCHKKMVTRIKKFGLLWQSTWSRQPSPSLQQFQKRTPFKTPLSQKICIPPSVTVSFLKKKKSARQRRSRRGAACSVLHLERASCRRHWKKRSANEQWQSSSPLGHFVGQLLLQNISDCLRVPIAKRRAIAPVSSPKKYDGFLTDVLPYRE